MKTRLMAVIVLFALFVSACGSEAASINAEQAAPAEETTEAYASTQQQHGVTLDEWVANAGQGSASAVVEDPATPGYSTIEWADLIPPGFSSREIYERFEERLAAVEFGSDEANLLYDQMAAEFDVEAVNPELNGEQIRLAGFVAPLTYEDEVVTEFLLVPNFGACIHVPPPPPNQTILVSVDRDEGLTPEQVWGAIWIEGTLTLDAASTDLAEASYTMAGVKSGVYQAT